MSMFSEMHIYKFQSFDLVHFILTMRHTKIWGFFFLSFEYTFLEWTPVANKYWPNIESILHLLEAFPIEGQYWLMISKRVAIFPIEWQYWCYNGVILTIFKVKHKYCKNVDVTLTIFPMKCQQCRNIGVTLAIYSMKSQYFRNIDVSLEIFPMIH